MNKDNRVKCAFLIPNDAWLSTIMTPAEIYSAIDFFWKPHYNANYSSFDISYLGLSNQNAVNFSGLRIETKRLDQKQYDMITIPALWRPDVAQIEQQTEALEWLRKQHKGGAIIIGVNTGQFYMATAGLLDGKEATIHKAFAKSFKHHFPNININEKLAISETDNLICTTGVRSSLEVMMIMIERFCGKKAVQLCAKYYEFNETDWFKGRNIATNRSDPLVEAVIEKIRNQFNKDLSLENLAEQLNVSTRNLSRRFQRVTGLTTMRYVQKYRLQLAKHFLANSSLSIEQIAQQIGFNSANVFGRGFKSDYGKSPLQYRKFILRKS